MSVYVLWRVIVKEFLQLKQDKRIIPIVVLLVVVAVVLRLTVFTSANGDDIISVPG